MTHIDPTQGLGRPSESQRVASTLQTGSYQGETVTINPSAQSILQEAAEEVTFFASDKMEEKKKAKEKAVERGRKDHIEQISKLSQLIKRVPDFKTLEKLNRLKSFLDSNLNLSPKDLLAELGKKFNIKDPTHKFIALKYLEESYKSLGDRKGLKLVQTALKELMATQGKEVKAGLNISELAAQYAAQNPELLKRLREFYRARIRGRKSLAETYEDLLEEYGTAQFEKTANFLMEALGTDLSSATPSTDKSELQEIRDGLYQLSIFNTIHHNAKELLEKHEKRYKIGKLKTAGELMQDFLPLTKEQWIDIEQINTLKNNYADEKNIQSQIYFMTGLLDRVVKLIPLPIFIDLDARNNLIDMMQESLDESIDQEEAEEEMEMQEEMQE